ncbi:MAG: hypothetical protein HUJ26_10540 [Planctomycetaceae bacterium]|nr:hypothetical protein [Planctomycetaceae bacterium]
MTIRTKRITSPNLFVDNDSILFDRDRAKSFAEDIPDLSAITIIAQPSGFPVTLSDQAVSCAQEALSLIQAQVDRQYRMFLFVTSGPWQESNRIVRYKKLWKLIPNISGSVKFSEEVEFKRDNKLMYAGLVEFIISDINSLVEIARTDISSAIICSHRDKIDSLASINNIFTHAFPTYKEKPLTRVDWLALAIEVCPLGDILVRVNGTFDDRESAVDIISTKEIISSL